MSTAAKQELVQHDTAPVDAFVAMVERAAVNKDVDVEKLERLLAMRERMEARAAKAEYDRAFNAMQGKLPVIDKRGKIIIRDKSDRETVIQSTPYALWEDINEIIRPILKEHGFTLSFRSGVAADGKITVTGILAHIGGHQETDTQTLPHDSTGSKNSVQAVGSSTAYGKRYSTTNLLNLTTKGEDDDGKTGGGPTPITAEQAETLRSKIVETGADLPKFLTYFKIVTLEELPASRFAEAERMLKQKATAK